MKGRIYFTLASVLGVLAVSINIIQAQPSRTGTNLNSKAIPLQILKLREADEVGRIRQLLKDGKKDDALIASSNYLLEVDRNTLRHESLSKYYAWNAYCTVLTSLKRVDEAISACTTAMAIEPNKWSAVNNRGTAKHIGGMLQDALTDYNEALSMVDEANRGARETIQHNISLSLQRQEDRRFDLNRL